MDTTTENQSFEIHSKFMTLLHFHTVELVQVVNKDKMTQNIRVIEFITKLTSQERESKFLLADLP